MDLTKLYVSLLKKDLFLLSVEAHSFRSGYTTFFYKEFGFHKSKQNTNMKEVAIVSAPIITDRKSTRVSIPYNFLKMNGHKSMREHSVPLF